MEGLRMYSPGVNLGAGGFVSYFDGGGTPELQFESTEIPAPVQEREYEERGIASFLAEQFLPFTGGEDYSKERVAEIRASGNPGSSAREAYYGEDPTFFETLTSNYHYPEIKDGVWGKNRHARPPGRQDLPTPQEISDARSHMLASAMVASDYGPETSMTVGNMHEIGMSDRRHQAMDKRNNAVGISLFKQAGLGGEEPDLRVLAKTVDAAIFRQLDIIMERASDARSFESPDSGPDLYIPRDKAGYFIPEK
jgi:hypothetical protein|tara:strand:- start:7053 stop:7808 length:756 start_codon:yes stop_codon:yes gene_type:complete